MRLTPRERATLKKAALALAGAEKDIRDAVDIIYAEWSKAPARVCYTDRMSLLEVSSCLNRSLWLLRGLLMYGQIEEAQ